MGIEIPGVVAVLVYGFVVHTGQPFRHHGFALAVGDGEDPFFRLPGAQVIAEGGGDDVQRFIRVGSLEVEAGGSQFVVLEVCKEYLTSGAEGRLVGETEGTILVGEGDDFPLQELIAGINLVEDVSIHGGGAEDKFCFLAQGTGSFHGYSPIVGRAGRTGILARVEVDEVFAGDVLLIVGSAEGQQVGAGGELPGIEVEGTVDGKGKCLGRGVGAFGPGFAHGVFRLSEFIPGNGGEFDGLQRIV